jgi:hypothetical protein
MADVIVKLSKAGTNVKFFEVKIDGASVNFSGDMSSVTLSEGGTHNLDWFAKGDAGSSYSIAITSPERLRFQHGDTLDSDGEDSGRHTFST